MKKMIYWVEETDGHDIWESGFTFSEEEAVSAGKYALSRLTTYERKKQTVSVCGRMADVEDGETAKEAYDRYIDEGGSSDCEYYEEI